MHILCKGHPGVNSGATVDSHNALVLYVALLHIPLDLLKGVLAKHLCRSDGCRNKLSMPTCKEAPLNRIRLTSRESLIGGQCFWKERRQRPFPVLSDVENGEQQRQKYNLQTPFKTTAIMKS